MKSLPEISPVFEGEATAIAMATSDQYVPYLYVSLLSIIDHSSAKNNYDIVILISNVTVQNKSLLTKLIENYSNFSIRFIDVNEIINSYQFFVRDWFHPIIYARLMIPDLMKQYSKVLYMDSDTIVLEDVSQLFHTDLGEKILGAVRDTAQIALYNIPNSEIKIDLECRLNLKYPYEYFNTGVILFNIFEFRKLYTSYFLFEYSASQQWKWQDQDVFMTLCEGHIKLLPAEWNVLVHGPISNENDLMEKTAPAELFEEFLEARVKPKIVHYVANSFLLVNPLPDMFTHFWYYARKSPYYEEILFRVFQKNYLRTNLQSVWDNFNRLEEKVDQKILPKETKVGSKISFANKYLKPVLTVFFPEGTKRRYKLRSLYHKLCRDD